MGVIFGLPLPEVMIEKQGPDFLSHPKEPKEDKKYETMVFNTLDIKPQRIITPDKGQ